MLHITLIHELSNILAKPIEIQTRGITKVSEPSRSVYFIISRLRRIIMLTTPRLVIKIEGVLFIIISKTT